LQTRSKRPLTLRDVSEASGVSEMTVSRVLRNKGDVSAATREKVQEAARRLGYVPNKIAGALASQRVNLVAVIIPSLGNMVFPEVLSGISEELEGTELQPVVGVTDYQPEKEEKVLFEMLSWRPSGVIIAGLEHSEASRAMLLQAGIPVVEIMGREMREAMLKRTPDLDFLYFSNDMIGAGGLLYLQEQGVDIPNKIGLAGFNGVELLEGLPKKLATMDACRREIGQTAARIVAARNADGASDEGQVVELSPTLSRGDTLRKG